MSLLYLIITLGFLQKFWNCFVKYYQDFVLFFCPNEFLISPFRNGRATWRSTGPDDGPRLGPQSADPHREQVTQDSAAMVDLSDLIVIYSISL